MNRDITIAGKVVGQVVSASISIDIDSDVRRPVTLAQPRIAGQFFKSGCSVAPKGANSRFRQHSPRYMRFAPKAHSGGSLVPFLRTLARDRATIAARNQARAMGIPSATKD